MEKNKNHNETAVQDTVQKRKIIQIVCSVLIALVVWFYVGEEKTVNVTTSVHNLPVEFAGEDTTLADNGLMLLSGYDTTVNLTLKGPRKVLWKLDKDEIRIVADTSSIQDTGVQSLSYQVIYPDNIQRSQIQVASASVYSITVTVGELYSKEVEIYCDVTGKAADGYVAEPLLLDPAKLVLRAQRDELLNVSYAKVAIDIANAKQTLIKTVDFQLYDYNDIPIENENIRAVTKLVQVTVPVKMVKEVPLLINFVEATGSTLGQVEYSIDPKKVQLKGEKAVLDDINSIVLDTIYLQDLNEQQTMRYDIPVPEDVELISDSRKATLTIKVRGVTEQRISSSNFVCNNIPEGYSAVVTTESLSVLLRGLSSELDTLEGNDLQIIVDLGHVKDAGNYTVPVKIQLDGVENVGVKGSYQVIVAVAKEEPAPTPDPEQGGQGTPEGRMIPMPDEAGTEANANTATLNQATA